MKNIRYIVFIGIMIIASARSYAQDYDRGNVQIFGFDEGRAIIDSDNWTVVSKTMYSDIKYLFVGTVPTGYTREYFVGVRKADSINNCGTGLDFRFWFTWQDLPGHEFIVPRDWGSTLEGSMRWVKIPESSVQALAQNISTARYWRIEAKLPTSCATKKANIYGIWVKAIDRPNGVLPQFTVSDSTQAQQGIFSLGGHSGKISVNNLNGNVGVGTTSAAEKLDVNGKIRSKEIIVEAENWPDYVFESDYELMPLSELKSYINTNKHLPEMPSSKEVEESGVELGQINKLLLKKIEELTLHLLKKEEELQKLNQSITDIKKQLIDIKSDGKNE